MSSPDPSDGPGDVPPIRSPGVPTPGLGDNGARNEPTDPYLLPWFAYGWTWSREMVALAIVPVLATLLNFDNVLTVLSYDGFHGGVTFRFPAPIVDAWTLTNAQIGGGVNVDLSLDPVLLLAVVVVEGILAAGYLGSIDDALDGGPFDFAANVGNYGVPLVVFNGLWYAVTALVLLPLAAVSPVLALVVGVPFVLVAMYLFYGTPYILVAGDTDLETALRRSYTHGRGGGAYARYGGGFLLGVAGISLVLTSAVVNLGVLGLLIGLVAAGTLGLALNVATMGFVRALEGGRFDVERETPADGHQVR